MHTLTVETKNIKEIRKKLNEVNICHRVGETNEDGSLTNLNFKKIEDYNKAKEILT